jgi:hypothetical protein
MTREPRDESGTLPVTHASRDGARHSPPHRPAVPRLETAVTMESPSHFFVDRRGSVGGGGIFVATTRELGIGQTVLVEVALHSYVLLLRGTVEWQSAGDEGTPAGMGIAFDELTVPARWVIERFCARRAPACYDIANSRSA